MANDCLFCKIISNEIPSSKIYEDSQVLVFLDINPVNFGHCLIVPKKHSETLLDCDEKELFELIRISKKVALALKTSLNCDGINLIQNNFKASGQVIFHTHFHLIPRFENDGFRLLPRTKQYSGCEKDAFAEKIKSFLK